MKKAIPTLILGTVMTIGAQAAPKDFNYNVERFADIEVLRYEVPGFDNLSLRQKTMVYYLAEAAHMGRDIIWDQHGKHNLQLRQLLEAIYLNYDGDKTSADYLAFETYLKYTKLGGTMFFTDMLKEAGLGNPFDADTLRRICAAAEKWLDNYDLSGIE